MLDNFLKHRPKQLLALYVEPSHVEVVRARRQWRKWQIDTTERYNLPEGESLYELLARLNLRPRHKKGTALVLFLPRVYYSFHREHYPAALQDQLEEALTFDWQENAFHEIDRTLHFSGPPVPVNRSMSVPIFSLQRDVYEKFNQVLGGASFQTFAVLPTALNYATFFSVLAGESDALPLEILGRRIDSSHLEVHRFYHGALLDSIMIGGHLDNLKLFRENMLCLGTGDCQEQVHIHLFCTSDEATDDHASDWAGKELSIKVHDLGDSLILHWVKHLLEQDHIPTFDMPLLLKPWQTPRFVWPLLCLIAFYALFAFYQIHAVSGFTEAARHLKKQNAVLETQWKPIEELQTRIAKFREDQKTLSQFNLEGYPLLEILTLITQVTPDDTWINYMSLHKGQLMLRGESKSAIKYLTELSKVEGFGDVRFASPVTRNPTSDRERFNLQLQIDTEKLKKTLDTMIMDKGDERMEAEPSGGVIPPVSVSPSPPRAPASVDTGEGPQTEDQEDQP